MIFIIIIWAIIALLTVVAVMDDLRLFRSFFCVCLVQVFDVLYFIIIFSANHNHPQIRF